VNCEVDKSKQVVTPFKTLPPVFLFLNQEQTLSNNR
jgi:hypothetical protein